MSREARLPSGLFGFGVVIASSTLVWQGLKQAQAFIKAQSEVGKLKKALSISADLSQQITDDMLKQMGQGLAGSSESTMLMLPSWLPSLPTGHETGSVLAVDFGGTSFRVMEVVLGKRPNHVKSIASIEVDIPSAIYSGSITELYDFIAAEIISFASSRGIPVPTHPETTATAAASTSDAPAATVQRVAESAPESDSYTTEGAQSGTQNGPGCTDCGSAPETTAGGEKLVEKSDVAKQLKVAVEAGTKSSGGSSEGGPADPCSKGSTDVPIGFCFSFPMKQSGLKTGYLLRWTKGFDLQDGIGTDPVQSLCDALKQRGCCGNVAALLNDGIGVFGAGRYLCSETAVSFILGTGTNAAYVERIEEVSAMHDDDGTINTGETVVNTEWGGFDSQLLPRCPADVELDQESVRPGAQSFEKLVGGLYVGEVVRRSFLRVVKETGMLTRASWGRLTISDTLSAPQVQAADEDDSVSQRRTAGVLMHAFGMRRQQCTLLVCWTLKQVVAAVVQRAADLIAAGLVALLIKSRASEKGGLFGIAVDGSVYHKYPKFRSRLLIALQQALVPIGGTIENPEAVASNFNVGIGGPEVVKFRTKFVDVQNGSCFGAAVVAAAASASGNNPGCGAAVDSSDAATGQHENIAQVAIGEAQGSVGDVRQRLVASTKSSTD